MTETPRSPSSTSQGTQGTTPGVPQQGVPQQSVPTPPPMTRAEVYEGRYETEPEMTAWAGWAFFGGIMMILVGAFQAIAGLTALFKSSYYLVASNGMVVQVNYTTWGWTHLGIGAVLVITGLGVLAGQTWARVLGIIAAFVAAIVNLAFIPAYPLWAIIAIVLDVVVIYALAAHGRELQRT